ncbi:DarT ssDNA thymidine ADP-ribosyltransferase family protein [Microbacterium sp.]
MTAVELAAAISSRGISRLTHFTNSRNLPHILHAGEISSTESLRERGEPFVITDPARIDGHLGHVCCNIEYPNMFYFDMATTRRPNVNYSDWVVFLIDPAVLLQEGVLFAPSNAARRSGRDLASGLEGLMSQYVDTVNERPRSLNHFSASPTDVQAEVLIPSSIPLSAVQGIVVSDEASLNRELARLGQLRREPERFPWFVSRELFRKYAVVSAVRSSTEIRVDGPYRQLLPKESEPNGLHG